MPSSKVKEQYSDDNFPIVAIGASAGGLDAFQKFLENIQPDSGNAYVLVQHLAPTHDSLLPEILEKNTSLPVLEITDAIKLKPNCVYIIPENKILTAFDGVLKLTPRDAELKTNYVIDLFFKSLAEVHTSYAIGIVFSGTGFDGTEGLKFIKENGGITYAQLPSTAKFDAMPQNAINSGIVDFVLAPEEMPQHLVHVNKAYQLNYAHASEKDVPKEDDVFKQILTILKLRSGNDFSHYKQPTIRRRIARRMVATKNEEPAIYLKYLRSNTEEQDILFNDVLIPVSYFFRDHKTFEVVCEAVFPLLLKNKKPEENIRIWVAGCSTGEEAYSLAICAHEYYSAKAPGLKIQIFASDLSERVISKARTAIYGKEEMQNVSSERLQRYFTKINGAFHIKKEIRDTCVFAVHNFLKDPPFAKIDLISCRNVLIYFDQQLQKRAMTTFHYALKDNGALLLGKSESISGTTNLFEPLLKNHKIFSRKSANASFTSSQFDPHLVHLSKQIPLAKKMSKESEIQKVVNELIFDKFTPAGVIINESKDIIHFHGDSSPFLNQAPGKPTLNVIKLAREGLAFELRNALLKDKKDEEISKSNIAIKGQKYLVDFDIVPVPFDGENFWLILFKKRQILSQHQTFDEKQSTTKERVKILEAELEQLRNDIRMVSEDQEAVNEELQSANEELLSNSEELQSLNEELETSSEELQSNNEELNTINEELMDRQEQLIFARLHAEAIVETIHEPLVILDSTMRIRSANTTFYKWFNTNEQFANGKLLYDFKNVEWQQNNLQTSLNNIIPNRSQIDNLEIIGNFSLLGERRLLANARQIIQEKKSEALILLAFQDITDREITKILRESEEHFRMMANSAPVLLWISDAQKNGIFFNKGYLNYTGRAEQMEMGSGWLDNIFDEDLDYALETYNLHFEKQSEFTTEFRLKRYDGAYRWISVKAVPRYDHDGKFTGFIGGCMDIHEQKYFYAALEETVEKRTKELRDSEAFLQSILNTTQNLIYLYDFEQQKISFINKNAFEVTGFTSDEIENATTDIYSGLIHEDDFKVVEKQRRRLRESSGGEMVSVEYRLIHKNGTITNLLSRDLVFKRDSKGNALQFIGVATDITDIRLANANMIEKNKQLEKTNVELASFSSIASHDLKEPLRKIQLFSKLVIAKDRQNVSDDSKEFLDRVIVSAKRMQQLIDDLISYTRTSNQKIAFLNTNLNLILEQVIEDNQESIVETNTTIESENLPTLMVIPSQFRQLFSNLIINAVKYSKADVDPKIVIAQSIASHVEIKQIDGNLEQEYVKITVSDNGIGFENEYAERIFKPFQRLHGRDEYSGTGIGLAICKKIMENHSGFIIAHAEKNIGATFQIFIPQYASH